MQEYKVQLDAYSGPLDLLLYLIRRDEIDVYDIPISRMLGQYLDYVKVLETDAGHGPGSSWCWPPR